MIPEFSRPVEAATINEAPRALEIGADAEERRKLAGRFRLQALHKLTARISLSRRGGIVHAEGEIDAALVQACVVTTEPVPAKLHAPFSVRYVPDAYALSGEEERELSAEDCDTLPLEGGKIDLGELAAETLALALDPFPRAPGADDALSDAGLADAADAGPFAGLQALKDRMKGE